MLTDLRHQRDDDPTPESIARARAYNRDERAAYLRDCGKVDLLRLVDTFGVGTVGRWLRNIEASLEPPSPGLMGDPRR